jgi:hypothetical protein
MSTSVRELKQNQQRPPEKISDEPQRSLVGTTVAFVLYPEELTPAVIDAHYPNANPPRIDYHYTLYERVKVDDEGVDGSGLMQAHYENRERRVDGKMARHLDPCVKGDGPPLQVPQPGHFTPGTWFDPSPFTFVIECYKDAQPEVRGISLIPGQPGPLRSQAKAAEHQTLGPFNDFVEAATAFRLARPKWSAVRMVFGRK